MYRILLVHDIEALTSRGPIRWAHARRSLALQKHCPDDFEVDRVSVGDLHAASVQKYDLVFNLDYASANYVRSVIRRNNDRARYVVSFNRDSKSRQGCFVNTCRIADWVVVNNMDRWLADGVTANTCCISNGVDTEEWTMTRPITDRPERVLWTGGTGPRKATKGYEEIILPAVKSLEALGFECDFRPVSEFVPDRVMAQDEMLQWYNSGSYVICLSESEATPNCLLEGMACGCVPVTTMVGNVPEFARVGREPNCVIVKRSVDGLVGGLIEARLQKSQLSNAAQRTMRTQWSYGPPAYRASYFFELFRALIERGAANIKPFSYAMTPPERI